MSEISKYDDIIDTRDVLERITELETEITELGDMGNYPNMSDDERAKLTEEAEEDLKNLRDLIEEARDNGMDSPEDGLTLIRDSYFEDYAQELAEDIGDTPRELRWPFTCIDWEKAARELQMDYQMITFDGVDYWVR